MFFIPKSRLNSTTLLLNASVTVASGAQASQFSSCRHFQLIWPWHCIALNFIPSLTSYLAPRFACQICVWQREELLCTVRVKSRVHSLERAEMLLCSQAFFFQMYRHGFLCSRCVHPPPIEGTLTFNREIPWSSWLRYMANMHHAYTCAVYCMFWWGHTKKQALTHSCKIHKEPFCIWDYSLWWLLVLKYCVTANRTRDNMITWPCWQEILIYTSLPCFL